MNVCPCGSQINYSHCCGLYLSGEKSARTPEKLMRSRYTAYSQANIEYIKDTMFGKPLIGFDEAQARLWAKKVCWIGLNIIGAANTLSDHGVVEFIASYIEGEQLKFIHEISEFELRQDRWFYVNGYPPLNPQQAPMRISRNAVCPCGSQKKFKNCHAIKKAS